MGKRTGLSSELVERIRARLKDDWRRTGEGDWVRTPRERRRKQEAPTVMAGLLGSMLESVIDHAPKDQEPLKPIEPLTHQAVAKVEKSLGFAIPDDLKQLYMEIGDGGFGPFNGIRRL